MLVVVVHPFEHGNGAKSSSTCPANEPNNNESQHGTITEPNPELAENWLMLFESTRSEPIRFVHHFL